MGIKRYLEEPVRNDLQKKIVLLSGPRQVGKTTLSKQIVPAFTYLSHDSAPDRAMIRKMEWPRDTELVVFDELHKMKDWKTWIKGVFDTRGVPPGLLVTGSARLDVIRKGGDSLAGRFFSYRLHPFTVREICDHSAATPREALDRLLDFGGFPEPYLSGDADSARRWRKSLLDTVVRHDLLDLERIRDVRSIDILIDLLRARVQSPTSYVSLARELQVSPHTIRSWLAVLESLCLVFPVRPYSSGIARSLRKEPKYYFYDSGSAEGGLGARLENTVAAALLMGLHYLEDTTGRSTALHYLRDKEKNEVDFLCVVDGAPVLMVEVKTGDDSFSPALFKFHRHLPAVRAVQVVLNLERKRSSGDIDMLPAAEFLRRLSFT